MLLEQLCDGESAVIGNVRRAACALAEDYAGDLTQYSGQRELGQHAVDAIFGFTRVFEKEDGSVEVGEPGCPDQRGQDREVAADQPAGGLAWTDRDGAPAILRSRIDSAQRRIA